VKQRVRVQDFHPVKKFLIIDGDIIFVSHVDILLLLFGIPEKVFGLPRAFSGLPGPLFGIPLFLFCISADLFGVIRTIFGIPETIFGIPKTISGIPETIFGIPETAFERRGIPHNVRTGEVQSRKPPLIQTYNRRSNLL
jgi:hypothetical protein